MPILMLLLSVVEKGVGQSVRLCLCVRVSYDDAAVWWARGWDNENEMLSWASFQGNADPKHMSTASFKVKSSQVSDLTPPCQNSAARWCDSWVSQRLTDPKSSPPSPALVGKGGNKGWSLCWSVPPPPLRGSFEIIDCDDHRGRKGPSRALGRERGRQGPYDILAAKKICGISSAE